MFWLSKEQLKRYNIYEIYVKLLEGKVKSIKGFWKFNGKQICSQIAVAFVEERNYVVKTWM